MYECMKVNKQKKNIGQDSSVGRKSRKGRSCQFRSKEIQKVFPQIIQVIFAPGWQE